MFSANGKLKWLAAALLAAIVLAGCGGAGNALPTPRPEEEVGAEAAGSAAETPEETWDSYLRDIIALQNNTNDTRLNMFERYQDPDHISQNAGGLIDEVTLVEDRTEWNVSGRVASAVVDFDIRIRYLDGDTETQTCNFDVQLNQNEEDGVWYVINPTPLNVFTLCG